MNDLDIYQELLKSDFPWEKYNIENLTEWAEDISLIDTKKQRLLGKIASVAFKQGGITAIKNLAYAADIPKKTLEGYFRAVKRLEDSGVNIEDIPEDLSWSSIKEIAWASNPAETLHAVIEEGLNFAGIVHKLGKRQHKLKIVVCPHCSQETTATPMCKICNHSLEEVEHQAEPVNEIKTPDTELTS